MPARRIHFNFHGNWAGEHMPAWTGGAAGAPAQFALDYYAKYARIAERGLFDAVFFAAGLALLEDAGRPATPGIDPVVLVSALAAQTRRIGFVITMSTTFNEPYNVARTMSSLDHVSSGRAGWNIVTTYDEAAARNFGMTELPDKASRYERAKEFVDVVLKLWDSWDEAAFVKGADGRVALDRSRIHDIGHAGAFFNVKGPLQLPRTPQRRPVLFQAGASEEGRAFSAAVADGIFCATLDLNSAQDYYRDLKARIRAAGRNPDQVLILPGVYVYLGGTEAEARRAVERQSFSDDALRRLAMRLDTDAGHLRLDEAVASEILDRALANPACTGHTRTIVDLLRRERLTVREFLVRQPVRGPHRVLVGDPGQVAGELEAWFTQGAADGFNVGNMSHDELELFVDQVVPILQKRGVYPDDYEGTTLREHYGFGWPSGSGAAMSGGRQSQEQPHVAQPDRHPTSVR